MWLSASNTLAGVSFYLQSDTGWQYESESAIHTPIGGTSSEMHWVRSPSPTRTIVGYVTSAANRQTIEGFVTSGSVTTFNSESCYILGVIGQRQQAENLSYLDLLTVRILKAT